MRKKSSLAQKLSIAKKVISAKVCKKKMPITVSWAITRRCNQKCLYCAISEPAKEELGIRKVFKIIDGLALLGTERISFTGGDPLLRNDLSDIIDYTIGKGILTAVNTNGRLVKKCIDKLHHASQVTLSLDGPEHIHDKIRGQGSYYNVIDAIRLLSANNIPVAVTAVLSKYNLDQIDFILNTAEEFKAKVFFQPVTTNTLGSDQENFSVPDAREYRAKIDMLIKKKKYGCKYICNSIAGLEHLWHWPEPKMIPCWATRMHCRIDCNGDMYSCARILPVPSEPVINCDALGVAEAFNRLKTVSCSYCWCAPMVELNLAMSFNLKAIINMQNFMR